MIDQSHGRVDIVRGNYQGGMASNKETKTGNLLDIF